MSCSQIHPAILRYMEKVENEEVRTCEDIKLLIAHVRHCFDTEEIHVDAGQLEKYLGMAKYFPFERLFEWEQFLVALHDCAYRKDGQPRWPDLFCLVGRGAGKDGLIAFDSMCMISPYNPIPNYDIDICANNEDQALRPLQDVLDVLEAPEYTKKLKKHFYWTKEKIQGLKTHSVIKGRTNNPKGKDGQRSGKVIFNEIHQYEDYSNINVFTTGLGKKKHPRRSYYTTNGDVREGPLDDLLERANSILRGGEPDNGLLPFICRLDDKREVDDPANWVKANPSLPYLPHLQEEIKKEYAEWKANPGQLTAFMTKRMNIPQTNLEMAVTSWENIEATKQELPDLSGWSCTLGLDFASVDDWAAINLHFRNGEQRYDINHAWVSMQSLTLPRIKAPWKQWAEMGLLTPVDDVEIPIEMLMEYILSASHNYNIVKAALDSFRYALVRRGLESIGFDARNAKNIYLVRPSDIMRVQPVIASCFNRQLFSWGNNPMLRWATNNTKLVRSGKKEGTDTGNYYYAKIEAKSRKTDPFMALAASMVIEDELGDGGAYDIPDVGVYTY